MTDRTRTHLNPSSSATTLFRFAWAGLHHPHHPRARPKSSVKGSGQGQHLHGGRWQRRPRPGSSGQREKDMRQAGAAARAAHQASWLSSK